MLIVRTLDTIRWKWHFTYPGYLPNLIMREKKKPPNSHRKASYKIPQYSKLSRSSKRSLRNCYSQGETKYNVVCTTRSWKSVFSSVQLLSRVWPHELQHARPPCPSPTPGVHSNSRPLSQWCHPTISSSVTLSPPAPSPSQHQSLFQWVNSSHQVAKVLEL